MSLPATSELNNHAVLSPVTKIGYLVTEKTQMCGLHNCTFQFHHVPMINENSKSCIFLTCASLWAFFVSPTEEATANQGELTVQPQGEETGSSAGLPWHLVTSHSASYLPCHEQEGCS